MIGIIHTHPGFQAFMSSVDMHALFDVDSMNTIPGLPMISIVLAPEENHAPIFVLTEIGREILSRCKETMGHHLHR